MSSRRRDEGRVATISDWEGANTKWRDRNLDPSLLIGARPPERLA